MSLDFEVKGEYVKIALAITPKRKPESVVITLGGEESLLSGRQARALGNALLEKADELENGVKEDGSE